MKPDSLGIENLGKFLDGVAQIFNDVTSDLEEERDFLEEEQYIACFKEEFWQRAKEYLEENVRGNKE